MKHEVTVLSSKRFGGIATPQGKPRYLLGYESLRVLGSGIIDTASMRVIYVPASLQRALAVGVAFFMQSYIFQYK